MSWSRYFRRKQWDDERAREMEAHLEMETEDNLARGMTPAGARQRRPPETGKYGPNSRGDLHHEQPRIPRSAVAGPSLRRARAAQKPGIYGGGRAVAGAGDRRQYGGVQPGARRVAAPAAVSRSRPAGARRAVWRYWQQRLPSRARFLETALHCAGFHGRERGQEGPELHHGWRPRVGPCARREHGFFPDAGNHTRPGPGVRSFRDPSRRAARHHPERRVAAARLWSGRPGDRAHRQVGRDNLHGGWGDSPRLLVSGGCRCVCARGVYRQRLRSGGERRHDCAPETGRDADPGGCRDDRAGAGLPPRIPGFRRQISRAVGDSVSRMAGEATFV